MSELLDLQFQFSKAMAELVLHAVEMGYQVSGGEWMRSPDAARLNAQQGDGIANSNHIRSLAVDLKLFAKGVWLTKSEDYTPLGLWWEQHHPLARWGGRFHKPDGGHFSFEYHGIR